MYQNMWTDVFMANLGIRGLEQLGPQRGIILRTPRNNLEKKEQQQQQKKKKKKKKKQQQFVVSLPK